jgi:nitric-oxide synthase
MTPMISAPRSSRDNQLTEERPTAPLATALVLPPNEQRPYPPAKPVDLAAAEDFLRLYYSESPAPDTLYERLRRVKAEIKETGSYVHTSAELEFGARVAWRNAARCIGRLYWRSLRVRDRRSIRDPASVAVDAIAHLHQATNKGKIRPTITIFAPDTRARPGPRIWNEQLIRYAGYRQPDGTVLGDPQYADFTELALRLGWRRGKPGPRTEFDILPLLISRGSGQPQVFELPDDATHEVPISHPSYEWFADLGLRWHAVPAISNMCLEIGGVCYSAAPFNGWYMGTEIGARNLADTERYDLLPVIAERLGYDTTDNRNLWRDRAIVELNLAVLHSFDQARVTITDHHTESRRFLTYLEQEQNCGRTVAADWSWIVPPISGSSTPVFHRYYDQDEQTPAYVHHPDAQSRAAGCPHNGSGNGSGNGREPPG